MARILLIDDEAEWLRCLKLTLSQSGLAEYDNIFTAEQESAAFAILEKEQVDLILLDLIMGRESGENILRKIKAKDNSPTVVIMTGISSIQSAINCINLGAADYLVKTVQIEDLITNIEKILSKLTPKLTKPDVPLEGFEDFITQSPLMLSIFEHLRNVASSPEPILITGESGTGKGILARCAADISRPGKPFVPVNVSGFDSQMFADALFGHVKGAFTTAEIKRSGMIKHAEDGTLFLDEIGDLSPQSQVKLLYLAQTKEYQPLGSDETIKSNARLIFATNQNLEKCENFRKDLFYRISTHHVHIPALRERPEDIPVLTKYFLKQALKDMGKPCDEIQDNISILLKSYDFPGNARQLRAMIYDAAARRGNANLTAADIIPYFTPQEKTDREEASTYLPKLDEVIENLIDKAIKASGGNQTKAAAMIGISQSALCRRLKKNKNHTGNK